jgi:hypothetical protein
MDIRATNLRYRSHLTVIGSRNIGISLFCPQKEDASWENIYPYGMPFSRILNQLQK